MVRPGATAIGGNPTYARRSRRRSSGPATRASLAGLSLSLGIFPSRVPPGPARSKFNSRRSVGAHAVEKRPALRVVVRVEGTALGALGDELVVKLRDRAAAR